MKKTRTLKAQSLGEYIIFMTIIVLATVVMQAYVKRGLQGRYADVVDFATTKAQAPRQYEPYYHQEDFTVTQDRDGTEEIGFAGAINRVIVDDMVKRGQSQETINYDD